MANTSDVAKPARRAVRGPHVAFLGSVLLAFFLLAMPGHTLPPDLAMPAAVTLLFGLAALVAVAAWRHPRSITSGLNYWDVAGALVLIGIALSALIEPEQMVRLVETDSRRP